jgi:site-specific DNA-methyltransferase (adenine-specific)
MSETTLYHGDCLVEMDKIPDCSVDMVMADPPYGTTACKWDSIIPLDAMWKQLKRVIKPRGAIVMTATQPFTSVLVMSNIEMFKYDWVWNKTRATDFVRAKLKPMGGHESVLIFSKASVANGAHEMMEYNPQGLTRVDVTCRNGGGGVGFLGRDKSNLGPNNKLHNETYTQEYTGYPNTKIYINSDMKTVHPTQKPTALMRYMIETYTNEGETVLDFTMGSGTTGVAAKQTGRDFIGIEMDADYFRIAEDRINGVLL